VTLNSMALNLTRSIGPAVGGLVVAAAGAAAAFAINALSFLPMIVALARWRKAPAQEALPREGFGRAVASGLRYVSMSPNLLSVIARGFVFGLAAIVILALLPLVARDLLGGGAVTYGLLLGAFGIGALGGGLLNARLRAAFSAETIIRTAFVGLSASASAAALSPSPWLTCLVLLPAGGCWVLALSLFNVVVQLSTPRWVVGRVLSIYQTASFAGMTLGAWLWGLTAESYGTSGALLTASLAGLLGAALGFLRAMPELVALNLDPLNRFEEPPLQIDLTARSGPIMILLEYDIAAEDVPDFLRAMADRRRIRLRDGARQWVLLRDLENPRLWKEAYHVPTWVEYVRHNRRRTQVDAEVSERLAALNGGRKPQVRRMIERHTIPTRDDVALKAGPMLP
jgi:MFS family permease